MKDLGALRRVAAVALWMGFLVADAAVAVAQKPPGGGGAASPAASPAAGPSAGAPAAGGSGLQGISYTRDSWDTSLNALPSPRTFGIDDDEVASFWDIFNGKSLRKDVMIFCYTLKLNPSATNPFILEPTPPVIGAGGKVNGNELCQNQSKSLVKARSLLANRYLVFRIDTTEIPDEILNRIQTLNINVTSQAGTSLNSQRGPGVNPATTQPSFALLSGPRFLCPLVVPAPGKQPVVDQYFLANLPLRNALCPATSTGVYYLAWPGPLIGDAIPSVSINLIYTPVAAALPWAPNTFYPAGTIVYADNGTGHYYLALSSDVSSSMAPFFKGAVTKEKVVKDAPVAPLAWAPAAAPAAGVPALAWAPNTAYAVNAVVSDGAGHYFKANHAGISGQVAPAFPVAGGAPVPEPTGAVIYVDSGTTLPTGAKVKIWQPSSPYSIGDVVLDPGTGHYFSVVQAGTSGGTTPKFVIPDPKIASESGFSDFQWQDLGATLPAATAVGTQGSDQTVNVLNLTYPQVHVLSRFNLTSGVIVSSLKPPQVTSYSASYLTDSLCANLSGNCTVYTSVKGGHLIDPVLGVSVYAFKPLDAEAPFKWTDLLFPAPTLNISLSSPTTNFHIGMAHEFFVRNLQIGYGVSIVNETRLAGTIASEPETYVPAGTSPVTPATYTVITGSPQASLYTAKRFNYGGYAGFTFNITGFIQSLIP